MKKLFIYSLKVWFVSITPMPIIDQFLYNFERNFIPIKFWEIPGLWDYITMDLWIGFIISLFSSPILFLVFLLINEISKKSKSIFQLKVIITFLGIGFLSLLWIFFHESQFFLLIVFIIQTFAIWFFKINLELQPTKIDFNETILDEPL